MRRRSFQGAALLSAVALALLVASCGGGGDNGGGEGGGVSGTISIMGVWSGAEQDAFQSVLDVFTEQNPDVTINYTSAGDQLPTQLSTAVEGGNPPDVAFVAQPGLMADLAGRNALKPIEYARDDVQSNLGDSAVQLGSVGDTLYGFIFKAANKSTIWYNVAAFEDAGVQPPETWDELLDAAATLKQSGIPAYSIGGADGWTLTDLFENLYLRLAGAEKYDQLANHEIPWTDQSVKDTLTEMAKVFSDTDNIAGGTSGALQTDFPTSVANVFSDNPKAAMVMEGDFVAGAVQTDLEPGTGFSVFAFPSANDSPPSVVGGGDTLVTFTDNEAVEAFVKFMTTADAATAWAEKGGFATLNKDVDPSVYPDDITRETASAISEAEVFRFDMSDLAPSAFGGTPGQGEWKILQDFLQNPDDVDGTAQALETAAARAFG